MDLVEVGKALDVYYEVRQRFGGEGPPTLRTPRAHFAEMDRLLSWMDEHGVARRDLRPWLLKLFEWHRHAHGNRPALRQLRSRKLLEQWRGWVGADAHRTAHDAGVSDDLKRRVRADVLADHLLRSCSRAAESYREQYAARGLCTAFVDVIDGYDPRSPTCRGCPRKAACADETRARVGWDLPALRAGVVDGQPPAVLEALAQLHPAEREAWERTWRRKVA